MPARTIYVSSRTRAIRYTKAHLTPDVDVEIVSSKSLTSIHTGRIHTGRVLRPRKFGRNNKV
jgi:hypothetical protein